MGILITKILSLTTDVKKYLLCQWFVSIGYFIVIPYLVIYVHKAGYSTGFASGQLSILFGGQYIASLIGGKMTDRLGGGFTTKIGLAIQILSYLIFTLPFDSKAYFCGTSLLLGISKGLYTPASKAMLAHIDNKADKMLLFSLRYTVNNIGVVIGSWIGAYYFYRNTHMIFLAASVVAFFGFLGLFLIRKKKEIISFPTNAIEGNKKNWKGLRQILNNKLLISLSILLFSYNFIYIQLESSLPLTAFKTWGESMVAVIFIVNSVVVILFQLPINNKLIGMPNKWGTVTLGFSFFFLSMLSMYLFESKIALVTCIVLFSIGEIIIEPTLDTLASENAKEKNQGMVFGILGAIGLLGGVAGNTLSGYVLGINNPNILWLLCAGVTACSLLFLKFYRISGTKEKAIST